MNLKKILEYARKRYVKYSKKRSISVASKGNHLTNVLLKKNSPNKVQKSENKKEK